LDVGEAEGIDEKSRRKKDSDRPNGPRGSSRGRWKKKQAQQVAEEVEKEGKALGMLKRAYAAA
jgi:hypothetical protein